MKPKSRFGVRDGFALVFGLFLGLCIWKFGNPVILDEKISAPVSVSQFLGYAWPPHWVNYLWPPLAAIAAALVIAHPRRWPAGKWLWLLPLLWLGWQFFSATRTVDPELTAAALWQFSGCVVCYFIGAFLFGERRATYWLLGGILAAFAFCLIRAVDQHVIEFPESRRMLLEGQQCGWTNFPPDMLQEMRTEGIILHTNGMEIASPKILAKFAGDRVMGTMVYPNALAGLILLLFPLSLVLIFRNTGSLRPLVRLPAMVVVLLLGGLALYWSGSKLGWLIVVALGGLCLFRLRWPARWKVTAATAIVLLGLAVFAVRFHSYFSAGATSVGARFDYWRAALQTTVAEPLVGTGPGTFQRPYQRLKSPTAEMARLTHNDYLEQFCDSGVPGGMFYAAWVAALLLFIVRKTWVAGDPMALAVMVGLLGWFGQGLGEFELYVPALAWTAFTLAGWALATAAKPVDKPGLPSKISAK